MFPAPLLTTDEIQLFLQDYPEANVLLDKEEFSPAYMQFCISLAVSEFNSMSPRSNFSDVSFPSKSILLYGALWQMFLGAAAKQARNQLTYSDGGLTIPIEEKYELYKNLADTFGTQFTSSASRLKISLNMEAGWGSVSSDEAAFPTW